MRCLVFAWLVGGALLARAAEPLQVTFDAGRRELMIAASVDSPAELRIESPGLAHPEVGADVGEPGEIYLPAPPGEAKAEQLLAEAQNIYFFNEFSGADAGWELVIRFGEAARGSWKLNGRFSPRGGVQREEVAIPVADLEVGENLLHLRGGNLQVPPMYFRRRWPGGGDQLMETLHTIPADWSGRVSLWRDATAAGPAKQLAQQAVSAIAPARRVARVPDRWWEHREDVRNAALAAGRNVLSNQVRHRGSFFEGGFNLVYDPSHRAHRMAHWVWSWGPSIDFLLQLSRLETEPAKAGEFREAALAAAKRSLAYEVQAAGPAQGLSTVRWEPSRATPQGWAEYVSTSDSLFLAGWGWLSAYAETKDPVYLQRTRSLAAAAARLMAGHPVVPQDWIVERGRWTPHTLDESVFGMIGFRRLHEATGSAEVAAAGKRFLDAHLQHMGRSEGLLARAWLHDENRDIWDPDIKGHAWVMEGYLDGFRLTHDKKYLARGRQLAAKVMTCQGDDGSWTYLFKKPGPGDAIDDKGTAIWAYLFYQLHEATGDRAYLDAARRATGWCLRQQYRGDDPNLDGAIYHSTNMAYVRKRPMTVLYTTTFFGLALLQELKVTKR